jgi:hypothetical protein
MHKNKINLNLNQIKEMYLDKEMTTREIAKTVGVSSWTIEHRLREMSIPTRNQSERNKYRMKKNPQWKAKVLRGLHFKGETINTQGYKLIHCPNHPMATKTKYVFEHRLVAERMLDRYLTPEEEVHHLDFNPLNNEPENLHVFPNKAKHTEYHFMLRDAIKQSLTGGI